MIQISLQRYDASLNTGVAPTDDRGATLRPFGDDGMAFGDIIDVINPLHHIPVLGSFYRRLTGDTIDPAMRIAGGALFGGPIGAAVSALAVAFGEATKADTGDPAVDDPAAGTLVAATGYPGAPRDSAGERAAASSATRSRRGGVTVIAESAAPAPVTRQPRRGGWIVALAYGPPLPSQDDAVAEASPRIRTSV